MAVSLHKTVTREVAERLVARALFRNHGQPYPAETEQECYTRLGYVKGGK